MSLSSTVNRVSYSGDDTTTDFAYSYYFLADGDLVVLLVTDSTGAVATQTLTTDYTVTGAGDESGGTVTMNTPPATGETLVIYRDPGLTQGVDLRENDNLPAETVEEALDRQMMVAQRTRELAERSIRLNDGFTSSFDLELPADLDTAGFYLRVNSTGDGFEMDNSNASNISNDDIASDAAIEYSKMEALTANRALATDGNGEPTPSAVTDTELGYLDGVTSNIQSQIDTDTGNLSTHITDTTAHGTTGNVVGTSDSQTLTNKTINGDNNTISNLAHGAEVDNPSSGVHGVTGDVVGTTDTQTLTNKTLDDELTIQEISTPSAPASGYQAIFADTSDNKIKRINSSGEVLDLGGGAGGGFNLEDDPYAQLSEDGSTGNWVGYDDGAEDAVDLTGGTFDTTFANAASDTTILSGDYAGNFSWTLDAADRQGEGVAKAYTVPPALRGKALYYTFRYTSDVALSEGDIGFYAYDVTNTELMQVVGITDNKLPGVSAGGVRKITVLVYTASDTASIRFGFHRRVTDATATVFRFSDIKVSDDTVVDAPIVSEWESYTPTITSVTGTPTNFTSRGIYKRVGDTMHLNVSLEFTGAVGTWTGLEFGLPSGLTIDFSKIVNEESGTKVRRTGFGTVFDSGVSAYSAKGLFADSIGDKIRVTLENVDATSASANEPIKYAGSTYVTNSVPFSFAANDSISLFQLEIPITEWANQSGVLSQQEMLNETPFFSGYIGSAANHTNNGGLQLVPIDTTSIDTHSAFDSANNKYVAPKNGYVIAGGAVRFNISDGSAGAAIVQLNGSNVFGGGSVNGASGNNTFFSGLKPFYVNKGDEITLQAFQNDSASEAYDIDEEDTYFWVAYLPDLSVYALAGQTLKTQTKYLSSDVTSDGVMSDLTFSNLTIGQWYEVDAIVDLRTNSTDDGVEVSFENGSTTLGRFTSSVTNETGIYKYGRSVKFQADSTSLTFTAISASANGKIHGNGTTTETHATLTEIPPLQETTEW